MIEIEEYVDFVLNGYATSDEHFGKAVDRGMDLLRVSDVEMSEQFDAGLPTIRRWRDGDSCPVSAVRTQVIFFLLDRANEMLREEREKLRDTVHMYEASSGAEPLAPEDSE